jgi:hypothetical protein
MGVVAGSISIHYLKQHEAWAAATAWAVRKACCAMGAIPFDFALTLALFRDRNPGWIGI